MAAAFLFHKREYGADGVSGAVHIYFHGLVKPVIRNIFKIISRTDARAVYQYIGNAEPFDSGADFLLYVVVVRHVNGYGVDTLGSFIHARLDGLACYIQQGLPSGN